MICGQCMLDDHRIHGTVKYASEVLDEHIQEMQEILPDAEGVIVSGQNTLQGLKSEISKLNDELSKGITGVNSYFQTLYKILQEKENDIVSGIRAKAKKREKRLLKRMKALNQAVEGMKKSKMTLEYALENRSKEIGILLEEGQLRARIMSGKRLVEEEAADCKSFVDSISSLPTFIPDESVEKKCKSISFSVDSPQRRRSQTMSDTSSDAPSDAEGRGRSNAFISTEGKLTKPMSKSVSGNEVYSPHILLNISPTARATGPQAKPPKMFTIPDPVREIRTKSLIGSNNHVTAYPFGVCCTSQPEGALLITDAKHHLFRIVTSTGKCLETIGTEGKGDGQFFEPVAITVDKAGNMLVLDGKNPGRLQKFSNAGE